MDGQPPPFRKEGGRQRRRRRRRSPSPPDAGPRLASAAATSSAAAPASDENITAPPKPAQRPKISATAETAAAAAASSSSTAPAAAAPTTATAETAPTAAANYEFARRLLQGDFHSREEVEWLLRIPDSGGRLSAVFARALLDAKGFEVVRVAFKLIESAIRAKSLVEPHEDGCLVLNRDWHRMWHWPFPVVDSYKYVAGKDASGREVEVEKTVTRQYDPAATPHNTYAVFDSMFGDSSVTMDRMIAMFGFYYPGFPLKPTRPEEKVPWPISHYRAAMPGHDPVAYQTICQSDLSPYPAFFHTRDENCFETNVNARECGNCDQYNYLLSRSVHSISTIRDANNFFIALSSQKTARRRGTDGPQPALWGYAKDPQLLSKILYGKWVQAVCNGHFARTNVDIEAVTRAFNATANSGFTCVGVTLLTEMCAFLANRAPVDFGVYGHVQILIPIEVDSENSPVKYICVDYHGPRLDYAFFTRDGITDVIGKRVDVCFHRESDDFFCVTKRLVDTMVHTITLGLSPDALSKQFVWYTKYDDKKVTFASYLAATDRHALYTTMFQKRKEDADKAKGQAPAAAATTATAAAATTAAAASSTSSSLMQ